MAHPMAYGDSQEYYRVARQQAAQHLAVQNQYAAMTQPSAAYNSQLNAVAGLSPYQNMAGNMRNVTPQKPASSPDRVIADRGFGGAESRPRMARYRKKALASIPVK